MTLGCSRVVRLCVGTYVDHLFSFFVNLCFYESFVYKCVRRMGNDLNIERSVLLLGVDVVKTM